MAAVHAGSTGLGQAHRWMVLEEGSDFKPLNLPPEHAQMLQTLEHKTRDIANVIGIQPHKLGDTARKSYNSLEQSNQEHLDDDLDPWLQKWEEELSNKLLTAEEKSSGKSLRRDGPEVSPANKPCGYDGARCVVAAVGDLQCE